MTSELYGFTNFIIISMDTILITNTTKDNL